MLDAFQHFIFILSLFGSSLGKKESSLLRAPLPTRATSRDHETVRARKSPCNHCIWRSLIGRKGRDCPSSLHTRRWRPKSKSSRSYICIQEWKVDSAQDVDANLSKIVTRPALFSSLSFEFPLIFWSRELAPVISQTRPIHWWWLIFWSLKPWPFISQTHPVHL